MTLLTQIRQTVIEKLWQHYWRHCPAIQKIYAHFPQKRWVIDHFALIDLPSAHSGIPTLNQLFSAIGYVPQGRDYLADKQNEFMWLAPSDALTKPSIDVAPQVVLADFRLDDLSPKIAAIVNKYTQTVAPFPWKTFHHHCGSAFHGDKVAANTVNEMIVDYCLQRRWPLPSLQDYHAVHAENELLAWVLVFGCQPSHFGLSIHHAFPEGNLAEFNQRIMHELSLSLNNEAGEIKGGRETGIAQSATQSARMTVALADGNIETTSTFVEFVWRYPLKENPSQWQDYFTGLIGQQANRVIESVYDHLLPSRAHGGMGTQEIDK